MIKTKNTLLGYSIYNLLLRLKIEQNQSYDSQTTFTVTKENFELVKNHFKELSKLLDDFSAIFGDLLGEDANDYIEIGNKCQNEILKPAPQGQPRSPFYTLDAERKMQGENAADATVFLLSDVTLNLAEHPDKDIIKAKLEEIYVLEGFKDAKGRQKTFIIEEPYKSILNTTQLAAVSKRLNKILKLKQLAAPLLKEKGTVSFAEFQEALQGETLGSELALMQDFKSGIFSDVLQNLLPNERRKRAALLDQIMGELITDGGNLFKLEDSCLKKYRQLLNCFTGVCFSPPFVPYRPSAEDYHKLYGRSRRSEDVSKRDLTALFDSFRNATFVKKATQETPLMLRAIQDLETDLKRRAANYAAMQNGNGPYSKRMYQTAIEHLEEYIVKVVNHEAAKITEVSVKDSLQKLAATVGQDFINGCQEGSAGRTVSLLKTLQAGTGDRLRDAISELKRQKLQEAFDISLSYYPCSSDYVEYQTVLGEELGIEDNKNTRYTRGDAPYNELKDRFFELYTPATVYNAVYKWATERFWELNVDRSDQEIYNLLRDLGFPMGNADDNGRYPLIDEKYRINGDGTKGWQYAYFQQDLPIHLCSYLIKNHWLFLPGGENAAQEHSMQTPNGSQSKRRITTIAKNLVAIRNAQEADVEDPEAAALYGIAAGSRLMQNYHRVHRGHREALNPDLKCKKL